jgi:multidrug efflux pump subunit AcrB
MRANATVNLTRRSFPETNVKNMMEMMRKFMMVLNAKETIGMGVQLFPGANANDVTDATRKVFPHSVKPLPPAANEYWPRSVPHPTRRSGLREVFARGSITH